MKQLSLNLINPETIYNDDLLGYKMSMKEFITREGDDEDAWVCKCANMPHEDGF